MMEPLTPLAVRLEIPKLAMNLKGTETLEGLLSTARAMTAFVEGRDNVSSLANISRLSQAAPAS